MPALRTRATHSNNLEVTTDAPPPSFNIISPTPRTSTFASSLLTSTSAPSLPYDTTFQESDFRPLSSASVAISRPASTMSTSTTPAPATSGSSSMIPPAQAILMRTLTPPQLPTASLTPPPAGHDKKEHRRRKSSSSDAERRPKKGDEDYIKRPENAFILFRRKCCEERAAALANQSADSTSSSSATSADGSEIAEGGELKKQRQADLSKTISQQWKSLPPAERQYWEDLAKEKKREHEAMYPHYIYRPQRRESKVRSSKKSRLQESEKEFEDMGKGSSVLIPGTGRLHSGRSASAPTPPPQPYQAIEIPSVWHLGPSPSCPSSPSLLPMISRRSSSQHGMNTGGFESMLASNGFDYMPPPNASTGGNTQMMPTFGAESIESSDFLRGMFNMSMPLESEHVPLSDDDAMFSALLNAPSSASTGSAQSSPSSGPFTPSSTSAMFPASFPSAPQSSPADGFSQQELDLSQYHWQSNSVWSASSSSSEAYQPMMPSEGSMNFGGDDFDLSSIPPIELGLPKYAMDSMATQDYLEVEGGQEDIEGITPADVLQMPMPMFDDMMAGNCF